MTQISKKTVEGIYQTTFSFNLKDVEYIDAITKKFISSNLKIRDKDDPTTYENYFKVLSICYSFYNFLTRMFNNYNGVNLINFNKQDFEYTKNSENIVFKINHPYLFHFKKINFNYNAAELLFHSKLFCDDFLGYDVSELHEIKEAIIDILFDNSDIISLSHNMFENMLGHKNNVKLPKELKDYFKNSNLPASVNKGMWMINSFEMYLINEAIEQNIIDDTEISINFEKLVNLFKKEITNINTTKKLNLIGKIYDLFYMEIYGEILEIARFCLMTSMYLESGIVTEQEIFSAKRLFQEDIVQKPTVKKLN